MAMKTFHDDNSIKPSKPVPANRIRVADFLSYVRSHQSSMGKYKEEFEVVTWDYETTVNCLRK